MGALEFIAAIVGSLAWPIVVLIVVVVLRRQIKELAGKLIARFAELIELNGPGFSFRFSEQLDELEREVEEIATKSAAGAKATEAEPDGASATEAEPDGASATEAEPDGASATDGAKVGEGTRTAGAEQRETTALGEDPLVVLLRAYRVVEKAIARALDRHGIALQRQMPPNRALKLLSAKADVDQGLRSIVADLATLRNKAVHEDLQLSQEDAERYTWIADDIAEYLDRL
ncbi:MULTISPECIES: hypothetical protein [Rhodococcus]|uniref:DUF4145 domain-containing protein n=1 Tax=Rhodococcus oxybenzonivorans TaxID=1990687 RepID=A0AAE5A805_9NOCA|nr:MULTISPECIES: hypothetical protein [Rhodococcus]MDV7246766.1 hypothetical protein [Rhodococcus oxybenzonivorans]MDV7267081.1 hypothetical protein [Rhodococcus oxybenzonivorans]MDV7278350.1 hypothetical protein [Rhodococcus oxybenzonivorans]MDV7337780.1 hypothetical protein [Rhodococcus oxybenzonivorans]MDV7346718.1 hypothetical protein [Rhodococcus oxybenzonivorans]